MNNPPADCATVITTFADFVEGEAGTNTWKTANRKMLDYIKRGVGINERVSPAQLEILRAFYNSGITASAVRSKSSAVAQFAAYLLATHELQEHLLVVLTNLPENQPQFQGGSGDDQQYGSSINIPNKRNQELNELYYGNNESRRSGTAASGSSKRSKRTSGKQSV